MTVKRRRFTADFKRRATLEALRGDKTVQALAAKHEYITNQVSTWKRQAVEGLGEVFAGCRKSGSEAEALVKELYAKIDELAMEWDFFSAQVGVLSRSQHVTMVERDGESSLIRQCELLGIPAFAGTGRRCTQPVCR